MNKHRLIIQIPVWLIRIAVGATFVMSGFVKAIDIWGSLYKFGEYFQALSFPISDSLLLFFTFVLCGFEFVLGVCILTGSYRKASPIGALCFMCVMLPLTLWIALSDPVKDCGCFGDFWIISNWATFWKNVVLTILIVCLIKYNRKAKALVTPALQWLELVISSAYIIIIALYGFFDQPLLDFRDYKIGSTLYQSSEEDPDDADTDIRFIYQKAGKEQEFGIDEIPDEEDGWIYVRRIEETAPLKDTSHTFRVWDQSGLLDKSEELFEGNDNLLLLMIPDITKVSPSTTWKINTLHDAALNSGIDMDAVVNADGQAIDDWKDLSMAQYKIYTADDTSIKEVVRGNPAIVYIENGKIKYKSTLASLNADEIIKNGELDTKALEFKGETILRNYTAIYLICLIVLIMLSFMPMMFSYRRNKLSRK